MYRVVDLFPGRRLFDGKEVETLEHMPGVYFEGDIEGATIVSVPPTISDHGIQVLKKALQDTWPKRSFHIVSQNIEFLTAEKVPEDEATAYFRAMDRWRAGEAKEKQDAEAANKRDQAGATPNSVDPSPGDRPGVRDHGGHDPGADGGSAAPGDSGPSGGDLPTG
jgi:hypothetical protein